MYRVVTVAVLSAVTLGLTSCGSSTTRTVTKVASTTTTAATSTTTTATPTTTAPPTTATTATTAVATTTGGVSAPVFFEGVVAGRAIRPSSLQLTGDGTLAVESVQWTSWGGADATGSGNAEYHGCTPNCAQATPHTALVSIRLAGIRVCAGRQYYSSVTLTMNSGKQLDEQFLQRSWSPC